MHGEALAEVSGQVDAAVAEGAKVIVGGKKPSLERLGGDEALLSGHYYEPTILAPPGPSNSAFQEEIFGPVITVLPFDSEDEAIAGAKHAFFEPFYTNDDHFTKTGSGQT